MNPDFFYIFKNKVILAEAVDDEPEAAPASETERDVDKILRKSPKVRKTLTKLLSSQSDDSAKSMAELKEIVSDIRVISYNPTAFRIILTNGNYFDMKYDPQPLHIKYPNDFQDSDSFTITIVGKKYNLTNKSEYEQCLDAIQKIQRQKAVMLPEPGDDAQAGDADTAPDAAPDAEGEPEEEPTPEEEPEA